MVQKKKDPKEPEIRWHEEYELQSVQPLFRRTDAIFANDDGTFTRLAVVGLQVYKVVSVCTNPNTDEELEREVEPGLFSCFLWRPWEDESECEVGPQDKHFGNFLGYDIEGEGVSEEEWSRRAQEYVLKEKTKVQGKKAKNK